MSCCRPSESSLISVGKTTPAIGAHIRGTSLSSLAIVEHTRQHLDHIQAVNWQSIWSMWVLPVRYNNKYQSKQFAFYMYWYPRALFTAEQACRRLFCLCVKKKRHMLSFGMSVCYKQYTFVLICMVYRFFKTQNRRETQRHSKWRPDFELSFHPGTIGDYIWYKLVLYLHTALRIVATHGMAYSSS